MSSQSVEFETGHAEMVHDAQLDYFGKRLATASSDSLIKIFQVTDDTQTLICDLRGHTGPVWMVQWGHPKFGNMLASCSYDGRVIVWTEQSANVFESRVIAQRESSINAISWAPHAFGIPTLAAAGADGYVNIFSLISNQWQPTARFFAHPNGCNAVSWSPDSKTVSLLNNNNTNNNMQSQNTPQATTPVRRLVTGGCDNCVKVWTNEQNDQQWHELKTFTNNKHKDWVYDVAWAPSVGLPSNTIASCSEDKTVIIWTEEESGKWKKILLGGKPFQHKIWRVSWSLMGNILAVSHGDNQVSLWKESIDEHWQNLSSLQDPKQQQQSTTQ